MTASAVALAVLSAASAALAAWWAFVFRRQLPLQREAAAKTAELEDLRAFASELLDLEPAARRPGHALREAAARALGAVHSRRPELALAALVRRDDGSAELLSSRGGPWAKMPREALRLDAGFLAESLPGEARWRLGSAGERDPAAKALSELGFSAALAVGWEEGAGPAGTLVAAALGPEEAALAKVRPLLELAAKGLRSTAALAEGLARLTEASQKLEGGLSAAIQELSQTHDRLVRKSRDIKTLHDVAMAVTGAPGRASSTLGAIVSIVARSFEADLVAFLILDETTGELVTQPGAYGLEGEDLLYRLPLADERASSVRVFKTRRPFVSGDAQNDPQVISRLAKLWRVHSLMVVPLIIEDRCIGVVRVGSRRADAFTAEHLSLLTVIAEEAAVIVETALLNRRLTRTAEQLAALNRMKDEFVSTVSHEFKTPLTTISGFLTVMLEGDTGALTPQQTKFLTIAKTAAKRLGGLVSDLLDLSRLESGARMELRPLDLARLTAQSLEAQQPQAAEAGKTLSCEAPAALPQALGDERWLSLVVDNLVSNAIKFTNPGGRIRVRLQDKGEFLMVSVSDDGIGIPVQDRERLFERFYRASNRAEVNAPGTGLGLSIAREVVTKHGGKIWFESEIGKGTTFHFVVPAAPREAVPA